MSFASKLIELKEYLERKRASLLHTKTVDTAFGGCSVYLFAFKMNPRHLKWQKDVLLLLLLLLLLGITILELYFQSF